MGIRVGLPMPPEISHHTKITVFGERFNTAAGLLASLVTIVLLFWCNLPLGDYSKTAMLPRTASAFIFCLAMAAGVLAKDKKAGDELFTGPVPILKIEIPREGMQVLRNYHQVWQQERPQRIDVHATVRQGEAVYNDVAVHLKGSYSFQGIDEKPSLTLNFDKFEHGRLFHGLSKIHLNNSV